MHAPLLAERKPTPLAEVDTDVAEAIAKGIALNHVQQYEAAAGGLARVERTGVVGEIDRPLPRGEESYVITRFVLEADPRSGIRS